MEKRTVKLQVLLKPSEYEKLMEKLKVVNEKNEFPITTSSLIRNFILKELKN